MQNPRAQRTGFEVHSALPGFRMDEAIPDACRWSHLEVLPDKDRKRSEIKEQKGTDLIVVIRAASCLSDDILPYQPAI